MEYIGLIVLLLALAALGCFITAPIALSRANASSQLVNRLSIRLQGQIDELSQMLAQAHRRIAQLETERAQPTIRVEPDQPEPQIADISITDALEHAKEPPAKPTIGSADQTDKAAEDIQAPKPLADSADLQDRPASNETLPVLRSLAERERSSDESPDPFAPETLNPETANPDTSPSETKEELIKPSSRLSLEEVLAGKVFVWIGAVALVLTAAFLLKLGFDHNIITEPVRVIAAGVFGIALWCVGEWVRARATMIAQVLCGAAVAVLYGTILAAQNYDLLGASPEAVAFGLMVLVTACAVVLSLRHGPTVAILGMLGGFMLPPVLAEDFAGPSTGMVLYLLALEVGILAVTSRRGWFGIGLLTLIFTTIWSLGYTLIGPSASERTLTAILVIGTAAAYLVQTARVHRDSPSTPGTRRWSIGLAIGAVCAAVAVVTLLVPSGGYTPRDLWVLGLISTGVIVLARFDSRFRALPLTLLGLVAAVLLSGIISNAIDYNAKTKTLTNAAIGFGLLFTAGGYACLWGQRDRQLFTLLSVLAGPIMLGLIILTNEPTHGWRESWWPWALALSAAYGFAAITIYRKRQAALDWPLNAYALTSFAMVCLAITMGLSHPRVAICLALISAVAALVDRRWFIRPLLLAACGVSVISAVLLVVPGPFIVQIRGIVLFNTLMPMFVLPAFGFGVVAWCASQAGEAALSRRMTWLCVASVAVLLLVLTRHAFFPSDFAAQDFNLYEWSAAGSVLMLGGLIGLRIAQKLNQVAVRQSSMAIGLAGVGIAFAGAFTAGNPLMRPDTEGGWGLALGLFVIYLMPACLMLLWRRREVREILPAALHALIVLPLVLLAAFMTIQVRNAFHASDLHNMSIGMFECSTYAMTWLALGAAAYWFNGKEPGGSPLQRTALAILSLGFAAAIVGNTLILNPLWNDGSVGNITAFNGLWVLFGPGIFGLAVLARVCRNNGKPAIARLAGLGSVAISFLFVSLLVRQGFSTDGVLQINTRPDSGERYAYSLAWVLFGGLLLIGGLVTKLDTLRYGSLAVLLIAVGKVFLIDTASLDNLYRVMSFFGLGVTLIGLGYLYQRVLFRKTKADHDLGS